jgi:hypothetical protein
MTPETEKKELDPERQRQFIATGELWHTLAADPKTRKEALRLLKLGRPETAIPELDMEDEAKRQADERVKPIEEENKSLKAEVESIKRHLNRQAWAKQHDLEEEDVVEIEAFAKDNGITKGDKAVELWRSQQLGTPRSTRAEPGGEEYLGTLRKINPRDQNKIKSAVFTEANRIIRESRQRRRAG